MHTERKIPGGKMQKAATAEGNKKIYWHKKRKKKVAKNPTQNSKRAHVTDRDRGVVQKGE